MHLIAVGRMRNGPEATLFQLYNTRLRPRLAVAEVPVGRGSTPVIKSKEGAALLATLPKGAFVVPLDLGGHLLDSEGFFTQLGQWARLARPICFVIGGAEGLDAAVIERADYVLSLGLMTWPHFMVRAMLAEQLYRAQAIRQGNPYHRAGRPEA
jgi:23S rRNA (pseudouridine1915-N3)-methyltransferase